MSNTVDKKEIEPKNRKLMWPYEYNTLDAVNAVNYRKA